MDDLFGHRQPVHMPKTRAVEDRLYQAIPSDFDDYRGIKDTDFSLEDFKESFEQRGYLTGRPITPYVLGSFLPKIDLYVYESIGSSYQRLHLPGFDDLQLLTEMDAETFNKIACRIPTEYSKLDVALFNRVTLMCETVERWNDGLIADVLEAIAEVCSSEYEIPVALKNFETVSAQLETMCDEVLVDNENRANSVYAIDSTKEAQLQMVQEDFDAAMTILKELQQHTGTLGQDILNITCLTQNIIGHCIRIEGVYGQFTDEGRPTKGKLTRFARNVEKILQVLDTYLHHLVQVTNFANAMIGLKNRLA